MNKIKGSQIQTVFLFYTLANQMKNQKYIDAVNKSIEIENVGIEGCETASGTVIIMEGDN